MIGSLSHQKLKILIKVEVTIFNQEETFRFDIGPYAEK